MLTAASTITIIFATILLLCIGCHSQQDVVRNSTQCADDDRLTCREIRSAIACKRLDECILLWKHSKWITMGEKTSTHCSTCKTSLQMATLGEVKNGIGYETGLMFHCNMWLSESECNEAVRAIMQLDRSIINIEPSNIDPKDAEIVCSLLGVGCRFPTFPENVTYNPAVCTDCKQIMADVKKLIQDNATAQEIVQQLNQSLCQPLPTVLQDYCTQILEANIPEALKMVGDFIIPEQLCALAGLCQPTAGSFRLPLEFWMNLATNQGICDNCKQIVEDAKKFVADDSTAKVISGVLKEYVCSLMPGEVNGFCSMIVEAHVPAILSTFAELIVPQQICGALHLCDCNAVNSYCSIGTAVDSIINSALCDNCKDALRMVRAVISDKESLKKFATQVDELICSKLPADARDMCRKMLYEKLPAILDRIAKRINPEHICSVIHFCPKSDSAYSPISFTSLNQFNSNGGCANDKYSWIKRPSAVGFAMWTSYDSISDATCDQCVDVLQAMKAKANDPAVKEQLKALVDENLCGHMGFFEQPCKAFINSHFQELIDSLNKLDLHHVCSVFGLCLEQRASVSAPSNSSTPTEDSEIPIPGVCQVCELIVKELIDLVVDNRTEAALVSAMDKVCELVPHHYRDSCVTFVDKYGMKIIKALIQGTAPKIICVSIGVCSAGTPDELYQQLTRPVDNSDYCLTCKMVVRFVYDQIAKNSSEEEIKQFLKQVCDLLPSEVSQTCEQLVEEYTELLIQYIQMKLTPEDICEKLHLCPPRRSSSPSFNEHEINSAECRRGPMYWCSSYEAAKHCSVISYCNRVGWYSAHLNRPNFDQKLCERASLDNICASTESAYGCDKVSECFGHRMTNFLRLVTQLPHTTPDRSISRSRIENCGICSDLVTRWKLQLALFGERPISEFECAAYTDNRAITMCETVLRERERIMEELRAGNSDTESICQRIISCRSSAKQESADTKMPVYRDLPTAGLYDDVRCARGPTYWCSSKQAAASCAATQYCTSSVWSTQTTTTTTRQPADSRSSFPLLGLRRCLWGPSYWCRSQEAATECGEAAVRHCREKVWLTPPAAATTTSKPAVVPPGRIFGGNRCTWGPAYWCSSMKAAKSCGPHAVAHCHTKVWLTLDPN